MLMCRSCVSLREGKYLIKHVWWGVDLWTGFECCFFWDSTDEKRGYPWNCRTIDGFSSICFFWYRDTQISKKPLQPIWKFPWNSYQTVTCTPRWRHGRWMVAPPSTTLIELVMRWRWCSCFMPEVHALIWEHKMRLGLRTGATSGMRNTEMLRVADVISEYLRMKMDKVQGQERRIIGYTSEKRRSDSDVLAAAVVFKRLKRSSTVVSHAPALRRAVHLCIPLMEIMELHQHPLASWFVFGCCRCLCWFGASKWLERPATK